MQTTRRDLLKISAAAIAGLALRPLAAAGAAAKSGSGKPLRILILGGTGFTGPHQVRYALARGHKVTLFNRGKQKKDWPGEVEELIGDRNTGDLKALEGREWDVCIDNPTSLPFWVRDAGRCCTARSSNTSSSRRFRFMRTTTKPRRRIRRRCQVHRQGRDGGNAGDASRRMSASSTARSRRSASRRAKDSFAKMTTIIRPGLIVGPGDRERPLHLLAGASCPRRRGACSRRRFRSGADHRCPRPCRVDHPHGRVAHLRHLRCNRSRT